MPQKRPRALDSAPEMYTRAHQDRRRYPNVTWRVT